MKIRFFEIALLIFCLSACNRANNQPSLVGRWERLEDPTGGSKTWAYEFFADGTGLRFTEDNVSEFTYKERGPELQIAETVNSVVKEHQLKFEPESENKLTLWYVQDTGKLFWKEAYLKKPMVDLPIELKKLLVEEIIGKFTILDAKLLHDNPEEWKLIIERHNQIYDYQISRVTTHEKWFVVNIQEQITATAKAMYKTRAASEYATKESYQQTRAAVRFPTKIPTLSNQDLTSMLVKASTLCSNSYNSSGNPVNPLKVPYPAVVITDTDSDVGMTFSGKSDFLQQASTPTEVRTLVCIRTDRNITYRYTNGSIGYRITQKVNILSWPDGTLLLQNEFSGSSPDQIVFRSSPIPPNSSIYGSFPKKELMAWVISVIE